VWSGGSVTSSDGGSTGCSVLGAAHRETRPIGPSLVGKPERKSSLVSSWRTAAWLVATYPIRER
jgi:hypothetical protein